MLGHSREVAFVRTLKAGRLSYDYPTPQVKSGVPVVGVVVLPEGPVVVEGPAVPLVTVGMGVGQGKEDRVWLLVKQSAIEKWVL